MLFETLDRRLLRSGISLAAKIWGKDHARVRQLWQRYYAGSPELATRLPALEAELARLPDAIARLSAVEAETAVRLRADYVSLFDYRTLAAPIYPPPRPVRKAFPTTSFFTVWAG